MKRTILMLLMVIGFQSVIYAADGYLIFAELIVPPGNKNEIPQAPRLSPDGNKLLYELYSKEKCEIWISNADGKNKYPLTGARQSVGKLGPKVENAFWHPSGEFIAFNVVPKGTLKDGNIYIARIDNAKILNLNKTGKGARPQFSKPYGRVIFYEFSFGDEDNFYNTLVYKVLGRDPLVPVDNSFIELRGPIQKIAQNVELSHPSLAPDGTTILFAARRSATGEFFARLNITDAHRQRAYQLWQKIVTSKIDGKTIKGEVSSCTDGTIDLNAPSDQISEETFNVITKNIGALDKQPTIVKGFTRKDFIIGWAMGLFGKLDIKYEKEIQNLLYSRVWMTDIFGAPIVPLANDESNVPLPQKWATVSKSGRFAIFEAGHYQNRHLYLANMKTHKAIKLTSLGTYNSSPEISPDEQWVYFESNRDNKKAIWRAKLDLEKINKEVGLE